MAYRYDHDLEFLKNCSSQELNDLVRCLIYDKDGKTRLTEELTMSDVYKKYAPNHKMYWENIAAEIQCFGANTFVTLFRGGKGVPYREVLCDVCDKLKVSYNKESSTIDIEERLFLNTLNKALDKMSIEERKQFAQEFGGISLNNLTPQFLGMAFQAAFRHGGFASYKLSLIIANSVARALTGKGLTLVANSTLTRGLALAVGPIGWAITGAWTLIDISGAAYRVTIPVVFEVALLRQRLKAKQEGYTNLVNQLQVS